MEEMVFKLGIEGLIGSVIGKPILTIRQENMGQARHMELIFIESIIYLNIYCFLKANTKKKPGPFKNCMYI